jgi:hypothetical protein
MGTNIPELDSNGLRKFGLIMAGVIAVLFGLVLPWLYGLSSPSWTWIIVAVLAAWSLILPSGLRVVYRYWMRVALVLGKVNTLLLLSIVFLFIIAPAGVVMRLFGYDPLQRKFMPFERSYRKPGIAKNPDTMEKPY